jgi:hypothetical protein
MITFSTQYYLAVAYGEGTYNTDAYNNTTTSTPAPGVPNTGFFTTVFSGANEVSLIPFLLIIAITVGAIVTGIRRLTRARK